MLQIFVIFFFIILVCDWRVWLREVGGHPKCKDTTVPWRREGEADVMTDDLMRIEKTAAAAAEAILMGAPPVSGDGSEA